jgi:hypothetical protein
MNQKVCGNNLPWPSFGHYTMFCVDELKGGIKSSRAANCGPISVPVPPLTQNRTANSRLRFSVLTGNDSGTGSRVSAIGHYATVWWYTSIYIADLEAKFALWHVVGAQRGAEWQPFSSFNLGATKGGGWLTPCPDRFNAGKETRYPLYRRLDGCGKSRPHKGPNPAPSNP